MGRENKGKDYLFQVNFEDKPVFFSIKDPENPDELLKGSNEVPYELQMDADQRFALRGGAEIPNDEALQKLLEDDMTEVVISSSE